MVSPYAGVPQDKWLEITRHLVDDHPLDSAEIVDVVLASWKSIFVSRIGTRGFHIGKEILPKPQIIGFLLHELIPLELSARYPKDWRGDKAANEKDLVYVPNDRFSIEVKTSSNVKHIFGNRSYAQGTAKDKKTKSGYYLAVNFQKFSPDEEIPTILLVRFGWIDSSDWIGQKAATGQQSRLPIEVYRYKFLELYKHT